MRIIDKLKLNKEYVYHGSFAELENDLNSINRPVTKRISEKEYEISPVVSLGTLHFKVIEQGYAKIKVNASISEINPEKQRVLFTTGVRIEHFLFAVLFPFALIMLIATEQPLSVFWYIGGLWIIIHLWFHFIYRMQENAVIESAVKKLKLRKGQD